MVISKLSSIYLRLNNINLFKILMKNQTLVIILILLTLNLFSQEKKPAIKLGGKAIVRVFANYHTNFGGNEHENAVDEMQISRAYLGYKANLSESFAVKLLMDVGADEGKYSAYLKTAALTYKKGHLYANIGMIATKQFKVQEKFWGYRYLLKSFQDEYHFNGSADLGMSIDYKINKILSFDAIVTNGEGYKHIESTKTYRGGLGTTVNFKPIIFRVYYDISAKPYINRQNIAGFVGYKFKKKFRIAAEYNYQLNNDFFEDYNMFGYSAYATFILNKKWEFFARYDKLQSNVMDDFTMDMRRFPLDPWNIHHDEQVVISGLQYKPIAQVKISLNYRYTLSAEHSAKGVNWMFVNFEYKL